MSHHYPGRRLPNFAAPRGIFAQENGGLSALLCLSSVELDFKQQEDKLQPVLRKLHPIEETQVAPSPYTQETYSATPKQKSKTESKKHGRWKLWFL